MDTFSAWKGSPPIGHHYRYWILGCALKILPHLQALYLVLIDIFVPSNDDSLLDPCLRKPSFHSLWREKERAGERKARSRLGEL